MDGVVSRVKARGMVGVVGILEGGELHISKVKSITLVGGNMWRLSWFLNGKVDS